MRPTSLMGLMQNFPTGRAFMTRCAGGVFFAGILLLVVSHASAQTLPAAATQPSPDQPMWVNHVEPILSRSCLKCHGELKQKGGLDLRQPQSVFAGGTDGSVVVPGRPAESMLYQRLQTGVKDHMPPEKEPPLSVEEISFVREWIAMLPSSGEHPAITGATSAFDQSAPSLMEIASRAPWQPPEGMQGSDAIDFLIKSHWQEQRVSGNGVCDDRTFVRRIYLDLAGRIPKRAEVDSFVNSTESQKRAALVDRLLAGNEYPAHMAEVLDVVLMERKGKAAETSRKANGWIEYLRSSIAGGRSWNDMVADMIVARPTSAQQKGAVWFLFERKNNFQSMAEAVAPVAFGVSVACAQCHNHPMAHEIKQQQYWGLVAAFNRTANVSGNHVAVSESAIGGFVNFTNLKKESQPAILTFPNDKTIAEDRPADGAMEKDSDTNYLVAPSIKNNLPLVAAVPKFSRRQAMADAVTHDNPLLARAFVNRMWAMLLGRGLVNPVDQMDSRHPPSHPELLGWLSSDFEKSGYDIRRLIRTIVLSRTYQLDSKWTGSEPPLPELFARGMEKPLSAEVLYRSMLVASGRDPASVKEAAETEPLREALIAAFPALFETEYNATLQQAMFLTNSPLVEALLKPKGENLAAQLLKLSTPQEKVGAAFVEILGREPDESEQAAAVAYLEARSERPDAAVRDLTWSLFTGTEFLLNH